MTMGIATAFSACSDEVDLSTNNGGSTEESTSQVFMQFNLELPAVSRSTTQTEGGSDAGVEIGKDYENQVSEVLVVITDATEGSTYDKFIAKSSVVTPSSANNTTYVVPFKTTELTSSAGKSVNVYVYDGNTLNADDVNINGEAGTQEGKNTAEAKVVGNSGSGYVTVADNAAVANVTTQVNVNVGDVNYKTNTEKVFAGYKDVEGSTTGEREEVYKGQR